MQNQKSKVIIYGLGTEYEKSKYFLESTFDILAYTDRDKSKYLKYNKGIPPEKINDYLFEYIYVTSQKHFDNIKNDLIYKYEVKKEKILNIKDMWWYVHNPDARDEWIINKIKEIPLGLSLLDVGAGNMPYKKYCTHLNYISQDFGEYDDSKDEEGLQIEKWSSQKCDIISDILDIPVVSKSIDVILCSEVFEHIEDPIRALQEFARIIKKNGILLLTAPFCSLTHMAPYYYTNGFSKYWYKTHLQKSGFEILEIVPYGNWFTYMAQEFERFSYVAQRYGKKLEPSINKQVVEIVRSLIMQGLESGGDKSSEILCHGYMIKARRV